MDKEKILVLAAPFIGDTVFIWDVANKLAQIGKEVIFVTYFPNLIQNVNDSDNITVLDISSDEWKGYVDNNLVISNHAAEKTEFGYVPEPLRNIPHDSYKFLDLHSKQKLGRTSKLENYPGLMWRKVMEACKIQEFIGSPTKTSKVLFEKETVEQKFPWTSEPYILIISGVSAPSRKYLNWEAVASKIEQSHKISVVIADDPMEHDSTSTRRKVFDLDDFSLLFGHPNCQMVLGSDTGLCHLAAWIHKHTALVFSISDPAFWTNGSQYYHPIVGLKNEEHIKKIQREDIRLDPPEIRGNETLTKEGFGANLTDESEILKVVDEVLLN